MRLWTKLLLIGFLILLINSAYLISFGETDPILHRERPNPHRPRCRTDRTIYCLCAQAFRPHVDYR